LEVKKLQLRANKLQVVVVPSAKLVENNPTGCINPLRFLNQCHKCPVYQFARVHKRRLPCKPHVNREAKRLLREREQLLQKLQENTAAIQAL
jgi:hypothetical protein